MPLVRQTIVNDSGGGTDGTIGNDAWYQTFCDRIDAALAVIGGVVQTTTVTGTQSNFALTTSAAVLRCNNASALTFTGFVAGINGQRLLIVNVGASLVNLSHNVTSTAGNRLQNLATSGPTPLAPGGSATYVYDTALAIWVLAAHDQGAWITPTFAAGDYTGNGALVWTVDAGDVLNCKYRVTGKSIEWSFSVSTSTLSGTANVMVKRTLFGYSAVAEGRGVHTYYNPAGVAPAGGHGMTYISGTAINMYRDPAISGAYAIETNVFAIYSTGKVEVV